MDKGASIGRTVWLLRAMIGLVPLLWVPVGLGQTTSITSSGLNTHVSHTAGQQNYDITGGMRPGNGTNLFHSFGNFSVGTQDVARFVNDAHLPTTNILSRVTGGNPSNIFGEINTTNFPGANLYLINPAGVLFGATATLNVSGSVHVSTADYLRLADGLRFNAIPGPQDTLLSQAPVVAFGFLNAHPHPITVQGSRLAVADGKSLSLVGGDIKVTDGTLTASSGQINLVSLAGKGEARVAPDGIAIAGMTPRGQIVIKERFPRENHAPVAGLDTSGDEGGAVVIRGGRLSLTGAEVIADARVANHTGRGIVIEATDSATMDNVSLRTSAFGVPNPNTGGGAGPISVTAPSMTASNSSISTSSGNNGPAGDVAINVGSLTASNLQIETGIGSGNRSAPASGNISIRATGDVTLQNSGISTGTFGLRDAGHITVRAATLALTEGSSISSGSQFDGSSGGGRAGNIAIDVEHLTMRTSSSINTSILTSTLTGGRGGDISVRATDRVILDQGFISSTIAGSGKGWKGGSITLSTPRLTLDHFGAIGTSASPLLASPPGDLRAGDISVHVGRLNMFNGGAITSGTCCDSSGNSAGNIDIVASRSISMAGVFSPDASPTEISSTTSSAGQAGRVHIVTPTMHLDDWAVVSTSSQSTGHAGSVVLDVGRLDLLRGARIESSGLERSGGVVINAVKSITLDKGTITTTTFPGGQSGQSGDVSLHAGHSIQIGNGSRISADTAKDVSDIVRQDAGNIVIQAGKSVVVRDSTVSARAQAETGNSGTIVIDAGKNFVSEASTLSVAAASPAGGDSGQIRVTAGDSVRLRNGTVLDGTNSGPGGDGAHIVLDAGKHVVVDASRVITPVLEGGSGRIEMHAGKDVRLVNGTVMDASAGARVPGGQIVVDAGRNILVDASQVRVPVGDGGTGQIVMHAEKDVRLVNGTVLDASSEASGGGQIVVTGGNVVIDNSRLTADTAAGSFGNAGKVTVIADGSVRLLNGTLVTASSPFSSLGGQVSVTAGDSVQLRNSTVQTSGTFGGGTIALTSETVRLKNGRLVSSASEDVGGTITIKTNDFRRDAASVLDVSGSIANGTINIEPLP